MGTTWQVIDEGPEFALQWHVTAFRGGRIVATGAGKTKSEAILNARRALTAPTLPAWAETQNEARAKKGKPPLRAAEVAQKERAASAQEKPKLEVVPKYTPIPPLLNAKLKATIAERAERTVAKYGAVR